MMCAPILRMGQINADHAASEPDEKPGLVGETHLRATGIGGRTSWSSPVKKAIYRVLREPLRRAGFNYEGWPRMFTLAEIFFNTLSSPDIYDRLYAGKSDPWAYDHDPSEVSRHRLAVEMLDRVIAERGLFARGFEIGCSEGIFTKLLAQRCISLLAVDFSRVAVERARNQVYANDSVAVERWNLRSEPIPQGLDLIVAMDVLRAFVRPREFRAARHKIVSALSPGGYVLVGDHKQSTSVENAWWAKRLIRGGKWVVGSFTDDPTLAVIEQVATDTHILALLRKNR